MKGEFLVLPIGHSVFGGGGSAFEYFLKYGCACITFKMNDYTLKNIHIQHWIDFFNSLKQMFTNKEIHTENSVEFQHQTYVWKYGNTTIQKRQIETSTINTNKEIHKKTNKEITIKTIKSTKNKWWNPQ